MRALHLLSSNDSGNPHYCDRHLREERSTSISLSAKEVFFGEAPVLVDGVGESRDASRIFVKIFLCVCSLLPMGYVVQPWRASGAVAAEVAAVAASRTSVHHPAGRRRKRL